MNKVENDTKSSVVQNTASFVYERASTDQIQHIVEMDLTVKIKGYGNQQIFIIFDASTLSSMNHDRTCVHWGPNHDLNCAVRAVERMNEYHGGYISFETRNF